MSGFCCENVGLLVGFSSLPDKGWPCRIIGLDAKCRKCRGFYRSREPWRIWTCFACGTELNDFSASR